MPHAALRCATRLSGRALVATLFVSLLVGCGGPRWASLGSNEDRRGTVQLGGNMMVKPNPETGRLHLLTFTHTWWSNRQYWETHDVSKRGYLRLFCAGDPLVVRRMSPDLSWRKDDEYAQFNPNAPVIGVREDERADLLCVVQGGLRIHLLLDGDLWHLDALQAARLARGEQVWVARRNTAIGNGASPGPGVAPTGRLLIDVYGDVHGGPEGGFVDGAFAHGPFTEDTPASTVTWYAIEPQGRIGLMTVDGRVLLPPTFDEIQSDDFEGGRDPIRVRAGTGWGLISREWKTLLMPSDDVTGIAPFEDGVPMTWMRNRDGLYGVVSAEGHQLVDPVLEDQPYLNPQGVWFPDEQTGKWGLKDPTGKVLCEPRFADLSVMSQGKTDWILVRDQADGPWALATYQGKVTSAFELNDAALVPDFGEDGILIARRAADSQWHFVLPDGRVSAGRDRPGFGAVVSRAAPDRAVVRLGDERMMLRVPDGLLVARGFRSLSEYRSMPGTNKSYAFGELTDGTTVALDRVGYRHKLDTLLETCGKEWAALRAARKTDDAKKLALFVMSNLNKTVGTRLHNASELDALFCAPRDETNLSAGGVYDRVHKMLVEDRELDAEDRRFFEQGAGMAGLMCCDQTLSRMIKNHEEKAPANAFLSHDWLEGLKKMANQSVVYLRNTGFPRSADDLIWIRDELSKYTVEARAREIGWEVFIAERNRRAAAQMEAEARLNAKFASVLSHVEETGARMLLNGGNTRVTFKSGSDLSSEGFQRLKATYGNRVRRE